jgi:hypothetical protein
VVIEQLADLVVVSLLDLEDGGGRHRGERRREKKGKKKKKLKGTAVPSRSVSCKGRQQASVCLNRVPCGVRRVNEAGEASEAYVVRNRKGCTTGNGRLQKLSREIDEKNFCGRPALFAAGRQRRFVRPAPPAPAYVQQSLCGTSSQLAHTLDGPHHVPSPSSPTA